MNNDIKKVLFSEADIKAMVDSLGATISEDYKDKNLLLVSVLRKFNTLEELWLGGDSLI